MSDNKEEAAEAAEQEPETTLGEALTAARERSGFSRDAVVKETRIPADYLRMLENDDYALIADQLYLLPFLRKYAAFLGLDSDETSMRFVREVQRIDNNPPPVRMAEPLDNVRRHRRRNWSGPAIFAGLIAVVVGAYIAESRHQNIVESVTPPVQDSAQAAAAMSPPLNQSPATAPAAPTDSARSAQLSPDQAMVVPAVAIPADPARGAVTKSPTERAAGVRASH
ncbi:MAG TPA: helix-turn-helix domain-containing protein [Candidatus Binataceae bacterium]|nr:helix-turn-helix domain-containing protein [Candidatus Binataceae bacterium]